MNKKRANVVAFILWLSSLVTGFPALALAIETNPQGEVIETLGTGTINWTCREQVICPG